MSFRLACAIAILLAGCAAAPTGTDPTATGTHATGTPASPQAEPPLTRTATSGANVHVEATVVPQAAALHLEAEARNDGDATQVTAGCQGSPWQERVEDEAGQVLVTHAPQPAMLCPTTIEPFPPGAVATFEADWNGTVWKGSGGMGAYERATTGHYTWVVSFRTEAEREGPATEVRFPLKIA